MVKGKANPGRTITLRDHAEKSLFEKLQNETPPRDDHNQLLHERQEHQIELEMQNQELQRAQRDIERSRTKYSNLYDFAPVGYLTLTSRGLISELNLTAAQLLGINRVTVLHKPFSLFMTKESRDIFHSHKFLVLRTGTRQTCELTLKTKDGISTDVHMESIAVDMGDTEAILSVLIDITERKRAEEALTEQTEELMRTRDSLQTEIDERKRVEESLRQSQKMEAIGTLAGGIAHDFNNILAAILGFTEMAVDDVQDRPLVEKNLMNVLKSATRAKELVRQILTFSRKTNYARSALSLTPLVKETVQFLRASIPSTIEIKLVLRAGSDTILAAPGEVQQILMNLATNASFAMQDTIGTLEIGLDDIDFEPDSPVLGPDVMPGEYIQLVVKDTGIGMSPEVMRRVFEPFFTTRDVGKGTGMGLAVVYGIVKSLQGTITVESEPGAGSSFRVFLPKVKTEAKEEQMHVAHVPRGTESILFVDDEEMLVEWGQATLERLGYSVVAMTDSRSALKTFSSDPSRFDIVITDQTMPSMTGVQLCKELFKVRPDISIILCTGHSETVSPETAKDAGIKQFLGKPLAKQELAEAVRKILDEKDSA